MTLAKRLLLGFILLLLCCALATLQNSKPIDVRPPPPQGKDLSLGT